MTNTTFNLSMRPPRTRMASNSFWFLPTLTDAHHSTSPESLVDCDGATYIHNQGIPIAGSACAANRSVLSTCHLVAPNAVSLVVRRRQHSFFSRSSDGAPTQPHSMPTWAFFRAGPLWLPAPPPFATRSQHACRPHVVD
jgi:hypothetical protein